MKTKLFVNPQNELPPWRTLIKNVLRDGRQPFIVAILVLVLDALKDIPEFKSWAAKPVSVAVIGVCVFLATFFSSLLIELFFYGQKYANETRKLDMQKVVFENVISNIADKDEMAKIEDAVTDEIYIMTASFFMEEKFGQIISNRIRNGVKYKYIIPLTKETVFVNAIRSIASHANIDNRGDCQMILDNVHYVTVSDRNFIPQSIIMYKYKHEDYTQPRYSIYIKLACADPHTQIFYYENKDETPQYDENGRTVYPHGSKVAMKHTLEEIFRNPIKTVSL